MNKTTQTKYTDRARIRRVFDEYTSAYDRDNNKIFLKIEHTYRVAEISDRIAASIDGCDKDTSWLLGMLHDIGRFEQLKRYGTFIDSKSIDHAALSADILFGKDTRLIEQMIDYRDDDVMLEKAVRYHNAYMLPDDMTDRERMYADILRDADKIDILKVNCDFSVKDIYGLDESVLIESDVSDDVLDDVLSCRNVYRPKIKTPRDRMLCQISFVFGLCYPESFRIVREQGYLDKLMSFRTDNEHTKNIMRNVRNVVNDYVYSHSK